MNSRDKRWILHDLSPLTVTLVAVQTLTAVFPEQDVAATFAHKVYLRRVRRRAHEDVKVILNEKQH